MPVPELCWEHGISSASFYKWRSKFGGLDATLLSRLKELEEENRRLKKCMPRATQGRNHSESDGKPSDQKKMAQYALEHRWLSIRLACQLFVVSECCYRYRRLLSQENQVIADWLVEVAH